jgi:endonuclease G
MNLLIRTTIISVIATASNANATNINQFINTRSCDQVIDKKFYKICYDYKAKGAKFVAYTLKGKNVGAVNIKKRPSFYPEKSIPSRYRTYPNDYTHNEFKADRGHFIGAVSMPAIIA